MTKSEFLALLAEAYDFRKYADFAPNNLDAADECLAEARAAAGDEKLDLRPFFVALLKGTSRTERAGIMVLLDDYFLAEEEQ